VKGYKVVALVAILAVLPGCISKKEIKETRVCNTKTVRRETLISPSSESFLSTTLKENPFALPLVRKPVSEKEEAERCEARLVDIPIPVVAKIESASSDNEGAIKFTYSSTLSHEELSDFYKDEMERLGWRWEEEASFMGNEILFSFKKPYKSCIVSMRPTKNSWEKSKSIKVCLFLNP